MSGALAGVRVIDLSTVLMGPFAGQLMGDMGADVIKVESPEGDPIRGIGPALHAGMGPIFLHANRSKRSVVLDLKKASGREALLRLCASADVLVFNIRPASMARLGLSYDEVARINPAIVYASLTGYGQQGRYASRPAYDDLIQGAVGLPVLYALSSGEEPRYAPVTIADHFVAVTGVAMILAALHHRHATGVGQSLVIPMFETMAQLVLGLHLGGQSYDPPTGGTGYARVLARQRKPYRTLDGYICVLLYGDHHWRRFFALAGRSDVLLDDPRFSTLDDRNRNADLLYGILADLLRERTSADWLDLLEKADIPAMPLNDMDSLLSDPHLRDVGLLRWVEHPSEGRLLTVGPPGEWSASPPPGGRPAPRLGEHSREVLAEVGYGTDEFAMLEAEGVTHQA